MRYDFRGIPREDAARAAGVPINTLDVWTHRYGVGGKVGSSRRFSPRDVAIIACARTLERAGMAVPTALQMLGHVLHEPPAADAVLVIEGVRHRLVIGDFNLTDTTSDSVTALWVGHIADHALSKLGGRFIGQE